MNIVQTLDILDYHRPSEVPSFQERRAPGRPCNLFSSTPPLTQTLQYARSPSHVKQSHSFRPQERSKSLSAYLHRVKPARNPGRLLNPSKPICSQFFTLHARLVYIRPTTNPLADNADTRSRKKLFNSRMRRIWQQLHTYTSRSAAAMTNYVSLVEANLFRRATAGFIP